MTDPVESLFPLWGEVVPSASSPKELRLEAVDLRTALRLNHQWHSSLPLLKFSAIVRAGSVYCFVSVDPSEVVYSVAVWSRPIAANRLGHPGDHLLELRRLAIPDYAPKYTATWMLGQMARRIRTTHPSICRLLSYQQTDVHSGTIYKAANWYPAYTQTAHLSWETHTNLKQVGHDQSTAPKVRWEYQLRSCGASKLVTEDAPPDPSLGV